MGAWPVRSKAIKQDNTPKARKTLKQKREAKAFLEDVDALVNAIFPTEVTAGNPRTVRKKRE